MAFDRSEVEKVAQLARLQISDAEADEVASRITDILALIDQMQSVDTEAVEPLAHPLDMTQRMRADKVTEQNRREELQNLAPQSENGLYLVPKVIECSTSHLIDTETATSRNKLNYYPDDRQNSSRTITRTRQWGMLQRRTHQRVSGPDWPAQRFSQCLYHGLRRLRSRPAAAADARRAGGDNSALLGIPVAHKDIFCSNGVTTSCGSRMLKDFVAPYDATVIENFNGAGAVMLGKTNMDEFAMGSSNETSHFGPVRNPWDRARVPGGSSGGSAAAVAADLCAMATGTDTGGSIRQPAAFCGVTGFKPSYGRVSRWGMIAFASSLDQAGPICKSAEDAALMLNVMAGLDLKDSTSADVPVDDYTAQLDQPLQGLKIGIPRQHFAEGLSAEVEQGIRAALGEYEKLGASVKEIDLPNNHLSVSAYYVVAPAEASANLSRYDGVRYGYRCEEPVDLEDMYKRTRSEGFGDEVKRRIMVGTYALSAGYYDAYYRKAQKIRRLIKNDFDQAFKEVDVVIGPTSPHTAFELGAKSDPVSMYLEDIYTIAVNLAGLPGISIPAGMVNGLPIGLHIVGDVFAESRLLNVAHQFQLATDWHKLKPELAETGA